MAITYVRLDPPVAGDGDTQEWAYFGAGASHSARIDEGCVPPNTVDTADGIRIQSADNTDEFLIGQGVADGTVGVLTYLAVAFHYTGDMEGGSTAPECDFEFYLNGAKVGDTKSVKLLGTNLTGVVVWQKSDATPFEMNLTDWIGAASRVVRIISRADAGSQFPEEPSFHTEPI